jgi:hypothetical protein
VGKLTAGGLEQVKIVAVRNILVAKVCSDLEQGKRGKRGLTNVRACGGSRSGQQERGRVVRWKRGARREQAQERAASERTVWRCGASTLCRTTCDGCVCSVEDEAKPESLSVGGKRGFNSINSLDMHV